MKWMALAAAIAAASIITGTAIAKPGASQTKPMVAFTVSEPPLFNVPSKGKSTYYIKVRIIDGRNHELRVYPSGGNPTSEPNMLSLPDFPKLKRFGDSFEVRVKNWPPNRVYTLRVVVNRVNWFCYGALVAVVVGKKLVPYEDRYDRCIEH
jgi:hypothetical protein